MKSLTLSTIGLILTCLTCNAQELVRKGTPAAYDSTVMMPVSKYRLIRFKVNTGNEYIASLKKENDSLRQEINVLVNIKESFNDLSTKQTQWQAENAEAFNNLNSKFDNLLTEKDQPKKWWERDSLKYFLVIAGTVFIIKI